MPCFFHANDHICCPTNAGGVGGASFSNKIGFLCSYAEEGRFLPGLSVGHYRDPLGERRLINLRYKVMIGTFPGCQDSLELTTAPRISDNQMSKIR